MYGNNALFAYACDSLVIGFPSHAVGGIFGVENGPKRNACADIDRSGGRIDGNGKRVVFELIIRRSQRSLGSVDIILIVLIGIFKNLLCHSVPGFKIPCINI